MVGADPAIFVRIEPVLRAYGSTVKRMGPVGSGQLTKLINNYFTAAHMETAAHELRLIRALGVDPVAAAECWPPARVPALSLRWPRRTMFRVSSTMKVGITTCSC